MACEYALLKFATDAASRAFSTCLLKIGIEMATSTPTIATTTRSSASVNPRLFLLPLFISLSILNYLLPGTCPQYFLSSLSKTFDAILVYASDLEFSTVIHSVNTAATLSEASPVASFAANVSAFTLSRTNQQHPFPADIAKASRLIHQNSISSLHDNYDVSLNDPF